MLTQDTIMKAENISKHLQSFCSKYPGQEFKPREVLPYLVEQKVFNKEDDRKGSQLRQIFRKVYAENRLTELIPQVIPEPKEKNVSWFIKAI